MVELYLIYTSGIHGSKSETTLSVAIIVVRPSTFFFCRFSATICSKLNNEVEIIVFTIQTGLMHLFPLLVKS
jgi:hypothetical protein